MSTVEAEYTDLRPVGNRRGASPKSRREHGGIDEIHCRLRCRVLILLWDRMKLSGSIEAPTRACSSEETTWSSTEQFHSVLGVKCV